MSPCRAYPHSRAPQILPLHERASATPRDKACPLYHELKKSAGFPKSPMLSHTLQGLCRTPLTWPHHTAKRVLPGQEMGFLTKANMDFFIRKLKKNSNNKPTTNIISPFCFSRRAREVLAEQPLQTPNATASPKPTASDVSQPALLCRNTSHVPMSPRESPRVPRASFAGATMQPIHTRAGATLPPLWPRGHCWVCPLPVAEQRPPPLGAAPRAWREDVTSGSLNGQQSPHFNNSSQKQLYIYNPASELGTLSPLPFQGLI